MPSLLDRIIKDVSNQRTKLNKRKRKKRKLYIPKQIHPYPVEFLYRKLLTELVIHNQKIIDKTILPHLSGLVGEADMSRRMDSYAEDADRLVNTLHLNLAGEKLFTESAVAVNIGQKTFEWNDKQWQKILNKTFGVNYIRRTPWWNDLLESFTKENTVLIKDITLQQEKNVGGILQRGLSSGARAETMAKQIQERLPVDKRRAKLIARDQLSKLNGQITQNMQTTYGIDEYIWRTSEDARVRPSHANNDGIKFKWANPPDTGHPGQDINCRCYAEPVLDKLLEGM